MNKITPTEIKAKEIADEIMNTFILTHHDSKGNIITRELAKSSCIILCNRVVEALNSVKGMGKISKVKLWKLVKENIQNA